MNEFVKEKKYVVTITVPERLKRELDKLTGPHIPLVRQLRYAATLGILEFAEESELTLEDAQGYLHDYLPTHPERTVTSV